MDSYIWWVLGIGALSAVSLPLGSLVGIVWRPRAAVSGVAAAFGAGALIAALTVELVAPTAEHLHTVAGRNAFGGLVLGALAGGLIFVVLDQLLNAHGGFLRKTATTITWFVRRNRERRRRLLEALGRVDILRQTDPAKTRMLVDSIKPMSFAAGDDLVREGEAGDCMFFIDRGEVEVLHRGDPVARLTAGDTFGEIALLTGTPRTATVRAVDEVDALRLRRDDFVRLCGESPATETAVRNLAGTRLEELGRHVAGNDTAEARRWTAQAMAVTGGDVQLPTDEELRDAKDEHAGAPLAIWLGILLDGIPESIVIGGAFGGLLAARVASGAPVGFLGVVPYTLIAGLFLSNFPEAMSSSVGMRSQGGRPRNIVLMWTSLTVMTALGAAAGYLLQGALPEPVVVGIEGLAAGAMLTMIASTMVPEAVHLVAAPAVGLSTLTGFLAAVAFKLFE